MALVSLALDAVSTPREGHVPQFSDMRHTHALLRIAVGHLKRL